MPAIESNDDALLHHARTLAMLACESYVSVGGKACQTCGQVYEAHVLKGVLKILDTVRSNGAEAEPLPNGIHVAPTSTSIFAPRRSPANAITKFGSEHYPSDPRRPLN